MERPKAPFTTSTLQQEANRKMGFTARRTMQVAQSLYENGYLLICERLHVVGSGSRTSSAGLGAAAIRRCLPASTPRVYASKVKNAQEAHEAIRPAGHPFQLPETLRGELDHDQFRLFDMIWKRTIACQMADANKERVTVTIEAEGAIFQASGTTIKFEGFLRAYVEGSDDPDAELAQQEVLLPAMQEGDKLDLKQLDAKSHTTQPPARFNRSFADSYARRAWHRPASTYASLSIRFRIASMYSRKAMRWCRVGRRLP